VSRRGATELVGILPVDKPAGMTSHDVVATVRRITGEGRVGHAGTLDPMATGLLVVLIGSYTRLAAYLTSAIKDYEAVITFGFETDTDDAEGTPTRHADIPAALSQEARAGEVLSGLLGSSLQTPPAYSAIKVGGKTAHREARAGAALELAPRKIEVLAAALQGIDADPLSWRVGFSVSKGTYIRALARDIGRACGTAAHLSALRRTSAGPLTLADAHSLDDVVSAMSEGHLTSMLADPVAALGLPVVPVGARDGLYGSAIALPPDAGSAEGTLVSVTREGRLAGVYRVERGQLRPATVLATGDAS